MNAYPNAFLETNDGGGATPMDHVGKGFLRENNKGLDDGPSVVTSKKSLSWADVVKSK